MQLLLQFIGAVTVIFTLHLQLLFQLQLQLQLQLLLQFIGTVTVILQLHLVTFSVTVTVTVTVTFTGTAFAATYAITFEGGALGEELPAVLVPGTAHLPSPPDVRDHVHHTAVQEAQPRLTDCASTR